MDDIVRTAKIPRASMYRIIGNKNQLLGLVVERELDRFLQRLGKRMAKATDFSTALVDATAFAIDESRKNRILKLILAPDSFQTAGRALLDSRELLADRLTSFVGPVIESGKKRGLVRPELTVADGAELLMRLIGSLTVMPEIWPRTRAQRRHFLERVIVPAFVPDAARR